MRTCTPLIVAALLGGQAGYAQSDALPTDELFNQLRRKPERVVLWNGQRVQVVNARYQACSNKEDARHLCVITPADGVFGLRVFSASGVLLMDGRCLDAAGRVPDGYFRYYDANGILRADGRYANGLKTGVWHRYDADGIAMTDKEYDGLDWDGL